MLSGTTSRGYGHGGGRGGSIGGVGGGSGGGGGGGGGGSSSAARAARTLRPVLALVRVLQCLAMAAVVYVVGTVACFYQQQSAPGPSGGRVRTAATDDDETLHAFGGRPVLCAFVLLLATTLGLALRARPRFRKILELHDRRSLAIRAAFIAAIMLLEVHALRRLGATGVALAEVSFQHLVLPTLAVVLLGQGQLYVPAKKLQGVLVISLSIAFLFSASHFMASGGDGDVAFVLAPDDAALHGAAPAPSPPLVVGDNRVPRPPGMGREFDPDTLGGAGAGAVAAREAGAARGSAVGMHRPRRRPHADALLGEPRRGTPHHESTGGSGGAGGGGAGGAGGDGGAGGAGGADAAGDGGSHGGQTVPVVAGEEGGSAKAAEGDGDAEPTGTSRDARAAAVAQRRRARRHGRVGGDGDGGARRLLVAGGALPEADDDYASTGGAGRLGAGADAGSEPAAGAAATADTVSKREVGGRGNGRRSGTDADDGGDAVQRGAARDHRKRRAREPSGDGRRLKYIVRLVSTWQGIKCAAMACTFVALAAALRLVRQSQFQLFGVKRAGALHLPMETLTTGAAAALVLPLAVWEHVRRHGHHGQHADATLYVHGRKFVPERDVVGVWQGIGAASILLLAGLVFAAAAVAEHAASTPRRKRVPVPPAARQRAQVHGTAVFVGLALLAAWAFHSHHDDGHHHNGNGNAAVLRHSGAFCGGTVEQFLCTPGAWPKLAVALATAGIVAGLRIGAGDGSAGLDGLGGEPFPGGGLPWTRGGGGGGGNPFAASALLGGGRGGTAAHWRDVAAELSRRAVAVVSRVVFGGANSGRPVMAYGACVGGAVAASVDGLHPDLVFDRGDGGDGGGDGGGAGDALHGDAAARGQQLAQACRFFARAVLQPEHAVGGSAAAVKARRQTRRLVLFLGINLLFMFLELVVGFYSNSLSLLGDAGHMFLDCAALVIGLVATYVAKWDGDARFTYGYRRAEVISGFANGVFLLLIAGAILCHAAWRLFGADAPVQVLASHVLPVSIAGFLVNVVGLVFFYDVHAHGHSHGGGGGGHGHSHEGTHGHDDHHGHHDDHADDHHGHDHHDADHWPGGGHGHSHGGGAVDVEAGGQQLPLLAHESFAGPGPGAHPFGTPRRDMPKRWWQRAADWVLRVLHIPMQQDLNMRGVFLHVLADTLGSASVIVSSVLIQLFDWHWFDCVSAAFTAILIVVAVTPMVREAGLILLQQVPTSRLRQWQHFLRAVRALDAVQGVAADSFWALSDGHFVGTVTVDAYAPAAGGGDSGTGSGGAMHGLSVEQDTLQRVQALSSRLLQRNDDEPPDLTVHVRRGAARRVAVHDVATAAPAAGEHAPAEAPAAPHSDGAGGGGAGPVPRAAGEGDGAGQQTGSGGDVAAVAPMLVAAAPAAGVAGGGGEHKRSLRRGADSGSPGQGRGHGHGRGRGHGHGHWHGHGHGHGHSHDAAAGGRATAEVSVSGV